MCELGGIGWVVLVDWCGFVGAALWVLLCGCGLVGIGWLDSVDWCGFVGVALWVGWYG